MSDDILTAYDRLLETQAIPFEPITAAEDWHLSAFVLPSFQSEEIFDIDHRDGRTLFYRTRFASSLWSAVYQAREKKGQVQPVTIERACIELPSDSPLVRLIQNEHLFRLSEKASLGCDGTTYVLVHAFAGGVRRLRQWEALEDTGWAQLFAAINAATELLPRRG